ncbi:phosphate/phosphite/phosphonate ABC transporter substrate-binding protein [Cylindrospermum sp. FACHB-282]|uniref:phosphate/phosphite/phosphonate ABC transporter substrate-binding protein n=1 Tax=Cylindrospermum sp. FACHB-282 TaxID=2692794 RepID=UPI001689C1B2|nr:phosphate/phosphite/phosphonate ABC transporter substrate-binding protein [Cylindrospermum sp. FACHB-282]MBD2384717.1 phosphate/phosphite/phosphonate ABC transporter substrate-binding protein [Cylindrospermum sp. FACHB-282]
MKRRNFIWYSSLFAVGCTAEVNTAKSNSDKLAITAPKKLKFAVTDAIGIEKLQENFGAFRTTLEEILGVKIEFYPVKDRTEAAPALLSGQLDIVFAGPSEYVILNARAKAIPIIAIRRNNYHTTFVVRADSKIRSLAQLKGKTIAMKENGSTSAHIAPTKMLIDAGLDPNTDVKIVMLGAKGVQALKKGEVDAWTISSDTYKTILDTEGLSEEDFYVISTGDTLPGDLFVASSQISSSFVADMRSRLLENQEKLIQSLLVAKANQKYQGAKLIPVSDTDYNMIREVYQKIGQGKFLQ